jgi:hypothetical protein
MGFHIVNQSIQLDLSKIAMLEKKNIPGPGVSSAKSKDSNDKESSTKSKSNPKMYKSSTLSSQERLSSLSRQWKSTLQDVPKQKKKRPATRKQVSK